MTLDIVTFDEITAIRSICNSTVRKENAVFETELR